MGINYSMIKGDQAEQIEPKNGITSIPAGAIALAGINCWEE